MSRRLVVAPAAVSAAVVRLPDEADLDAWVGYLRERTAQEWRPAEFDPAVWLFTADVGNPLTTSTTCKAAGCVTVVASQTVCSSCRRALEASGLAEVEFLSSYRRPALVANRRTGARCVVTRGGLQCGRRQVSTRTGLCQAHGTDWYRIRERERVSLHVWCTRRAEPLPARRGCLVPGCAADGKLDDGLCGHHFRFWRRAQIGQPAGRREAPAQWAGRQLPRRLQVHQFSLATAAPVLRWELLYALQQRDAQGLKLDPSAVRGLVTVLAGVATLTAVTPGQVMEQVPAAARHVRAYAHMLTRVVGLTFEAYRGQSHTERDVWDCLALDLDTPRPGRRPNLATVDFTCIAQPWLREAVKDWAAAARPDSNMLGRTLAACALASRALAARPGGGHDVRAVRFADMTAVFTAFAASTRADGQPYGGRYRRGLWARFHTVIDFGRSTDRLADLPAAFARNRTHTLPNTETNEDEIGKAIPEPVIAALDAHLHLLGTDRTYGRAWSATDTAAIFTAVYLVLRDTGRRPGEVVTLGVDCLEFDAGQWSLVYDNHKKRRLRRRLPITADTATGIQAWQAHRARLLLPASSRPWLFPAPTESTGPGHLTTNRLVRAIKAWAALIPALDSDLPGLDGAPVPFDRSLIVPRAFRHSYAQRHADAGVSVEILKELMDHRDMTVTQGYYTVSLKRKREAIAVMSRYVHDRTGTPVAGTVSATRYELRSVAVPFGNCIEPSNVKAGGKQCPIRFQCAGCGFYRPDPSYLPAIDEHINALKADRETARAIDADPFVIGNLTDQATAFGQVADAMRAKLDSLPEAERAQVEQAGALLRKARSAQDLPVQDLTAQDVSGGRPQLPLTVAGQPVTAAR